ARLDELETALAADRAEVRAELETAGRHVGLDGLPDPLAEPGARNPVAVLAAALEHRLRTIDVLADASCAGAAAHRSGAGRCVGCDVLLDGSGFADGAGALAAVLDDADRGALAGRVAARDAARAATAAGLADPALAALAEDARPDVAAA